MMYSGILTSFISIINLFFPILNLRMFQNGRLGGSFQYANTFGLFVMICFILFIYKQNKRPYEYIGSIFIIIAIILTYSRSTILLGAVAFVFISGYYLWHHYEGIKSSLKEYFWICLCIVSGLVLSLILGEIFELNHMAERLTEGLSAGEWQIRMIYYKDALSMLFRFPFGTGHLGYYYIQRAYQTGSMYHIKYVHNGLLQIGLDIGLLGMVLFLVFFGYNILRRKISWLLKLILVLFFIHSLIDFDLEFSYMSIIIILIVSGEGEKRIFQESRAFRKIYFGFHVLSIFIYSYTALFTLLSYYGNNELAYTLYPLYTEAKLDALESGQLTNQESILVCHSIISINDYVVEPHIFLRDDYIEKGMLNEAVEESELILGLNPLKLEHVEVYSDILLANAKENLLVHDYKKVEESLNIIKNISNYLDSLANRVHTTYNVKHMPELIMTNRLRRNYNEALLMEEALKK